MSSEVLHFNVPQKVFTAFCLGHRAVRTPENLQLSPLKVSHRVKDHNLLSEKMLAVMLPV